MPRIAARYLRTIKIHRLEGRQRHQVAEVKAYNLPDAVRVWYATVSWRFSDPLFKANTVTVTAKDGEQEVYVATD